MDKREIEESILAYKNEMIDKLSEFVSINSVYDANSVDENNPFGKGVSNALDYFYNLAKKDGFDVINYDNYCVEISYGEGEIIDILAHCDVVDVSSNWKIAPFSKYYDNEYVYGRGTQDDKGPLLAAYYALKVLKDKKIAINKKIRFIVGGNEESGSSCLTYYYKTLNKEYPKMGFTPDAEFPLINGEKGITRIKLSIPCLEIENITGGKALNIVMDDLILKYKGKERKYVGKAAHASKPELGVNAFVVAMEDLKNDDIVFNKLYLDFKDYYGSGLDIDSSDDKLGKLTMNVGKVDKIGDRLSIVLDIRYPLSISASEIMNRIINKGYECEILMDEHPIYMDENSELVRKLLSSYKQFTNKEAKPFTIGGGTYAKSSKNVVAFGMLFEDDIDCMHQDNEKLSINHYLLGAMIYLKAILELIK